MSHRKQVVNAAPRSGDRYGRRIRPRRPNYRIAQVQLPWH